MNNHEWEQYSKTVDALGLGRASKSKNGSIIKQAIGNSKWLVLISAVSFGLTALFGMLSHVVLVSANLVASILLVLLLMGVSILFDLVGMAVAAGSAKPLIIAVNKKTKGAREALHLVMNAEKVSCFCCDVVGDICSILSGAAGAAITLYLVDGVAPVVEVIIATCISSFIAALTVLGKATGKGYAINHSTNIVLFAGKALRPFYRRHKK